MRVSFSDRLVPRWSGLAAVEPVALREPVAFRGLVALGEGRRVLETPSAAAGPRTARPGSAERGHLDHGRAEDRALETPSAAHTSITASSTTAGPGDAERGHLDYGGRAERGGSWKR